MRIIAEVPRFESKVSTLEFLRHLLNSCHLFLSCGLIGYDQVVKQFINITHIACHAMLQHIVGIGLMSKKLSQFAAQVYKPFTNLDIILRIVVDTLRILRHIHLTTEFTLGAVCHKRRIRGKVEREYPAILLLFLRCKSSSLTSCFRQTVKLGFIRNMQSESLILLQQVLRKLQAKHRCLFRQLSKPFLASGIEQSSAAYEAIITVVEQHLLLRCQLTMMTMYILNTFE